MNRKKVFYTEAAYAAGIVILALGTAFMERADFGLSMVVAPAYLFHLKISQYLPWFSFGMAEYSLQAVVLVILSLLMRRFRPMYLFSFVTAVIYGFTLDLAMLIVGVLPLAGLVGRIAFFLIGMLLCAVGVSLFFHTYIPPEAYELFVKEISAKSRADINVVKTVYDCCSCLIGIVLSFAFFGLWHFEGVKIGTILCALANGFLIGKCSKLMESVFHFQDGMNLRKRFERD